MRNIDEIMAQRFYAGETSSIYLVIALHGYIMMFYILLYADGIH